MLADQAAVVDVCEHPHQKSVQRCECITDSKLDKTYWQSILSVIPPWPGMLSPKSLMSNARLNPDAKKPPNGATNDAKKASRRI